MLVYWYKYLNRTTLRTSSTSEYSAHKPFAPQYELEMHVLRNRKVDTRGKGITVARGSLDRYMHQRM
jgi:hypothetical protein